jgi:GLPGLI family protein
MKILFFTLFVIAFTVLLAGVALGQKKVAELTLVYNYSLTSAGQTSPLLNATHTVYLKSNKSRTELQSPQYSSSTIYDAISGSAVILRELSGQKLLIRLNPDNWEDKNKSFMGIHFENLPETKIIAGYKAEKATAATKDGYTVTVYYTRDIIPNNKEYDPLFKNLDGLPLEYELSKGESTIRYTLASINLNPVPASKFDIPTAGFREMTYDESKKLHTGS